MHTITLSFPTLTEMHAAVSHLLGGGFGILGQAPAALPASQTGLVNKGKAKPAAAPAPVEAPAPAVAASASAPAASAPAASVPKADAAVDYPTLQKAVFKLAGVPEKGRAAATELLAKFNVATFKELAEERWAEALAAVESKIKELA